MFKSIKWRLTGVFFLVTTVFLFLLGLFLINTMEQYTYDNIQNKLQSFARLMSEDIRTSFIKEPYPGYINDYTKKAQEDIGARVTIIDTSGKVMGDSSLDKDSMANHSDRPEFKKAMEGEIGQSVRYSSSLNKKMAYFAAPIESDNKIIGVVRVAMPWDEVQSGLNKIRIIIASAIVISLILTIVVAFSFTSSIVIPLQEMTSVALEMAEGKLDMSIDVISDDEIGKLGRGLNYMAQRLRDTIRQITEEKNKVKAILKSINDGVIAIDRKGTILLINPAVEKMFNICYEKSLGKTVIEVVRNFDLEKLLFQALKSGQSISDEIQLLVPDPKTFRIVTAPLKNEKEVVGVVAVLRDITAFREVERMKTDFVANVSHELRTPLTSVKGFVETLLDGALEEPETARHFLEIISDETDRLNRLINDLLSLSRIEAKNMEANKEKLSLAKIMNNTLSILTPQAKEKVLDVELRIAPDLPMVMADEDMIGQMLINLVDNAIKYTPRGGKVSIKAEKENDAVKIVISDTGIGIPRESIPRLFERFYRVDKARSREMGGTGLGLAIVKHILELHHGRIEVESDVARGSTFTVYLPVGG